jgi:hypothetical protein
MPYEDLRQYLKVLEERGLLCHVKAEVDKDWEISAVCRRTFRAIPQERRPALMFDCIKGYNIPLVVGILGGSREIYATALETDQAGVWEKWARASHPVPPQLVESGPCQEVVHMGEEADIEMLPAPVWTVGQDPGPYHTSPFVISRDPETGKLQWRWYTEPKAGEPGSETWPDNDTMLHGGGKHAHLATTTVDRAQPHAQGFSDRHLSQTLSTYSITCDGKHS